MAVYGDYDVDGITSVSVLYLALKEMKADVIYFIPDRSKEGYGVNADAVRRLGEQGVSLIITVDCGITAIDEVRLGKELGIDTIITDHHKCPGKIPAALAVINPKQPGCSYPFQDLAGVGVAFKLVQALMGMENLPVLMEQYGALVALGTVADIVPLKDGYGVLWNQEYEEGEKSWDSGTFAGGRVCGERNHFGDTGISAGA